MQGGVKSKLYLDLYWDVGKSLVWSSVLFLPHLVGTFCCGRPGVHCVATLRSTHHGRPGVPYIVRLHYDPPTMGALDYPTVGVHYDPPTVGALEYPTVGVHYDPPTHRGCPGVPYIVGVHYDPPTMGTLCFRLASVFDSLHKPLYFVTV